LVFEIDIVIVIDLLLLITDSLALIAVEILFFNLTGFRNLLGLEKDWTGKQEIASNKKSF